MIIEFFAKLFVLNMVYDAPLGAIFMMGNSLGVVLWKKHKGVIYDWEKV